MNVHDSGVEFWGLPSSGACRHVFWFIGTEVSEEGDSRLSVKLYKTTRRHVPEGSNFHSYDLEDLTVVTFVCDFRTFGVGLPVRYVIALNIMRPCLCCVCVCVFHKVLTHLKFFFYRKT